MVKTIPYKKSAAQIAWNKLTKEQQEEEEIRQNEEENKREEKAELERKTKLAEEKEDQQMQDDWSMMIEETRIANEETRLEEDKRLAFIAKARALNTPRKEKVSITGNKHIPQPVIKVLAAFTHVTPSRVEQADVAAAIKKAGLAFDLNAEGHWKKVLNYLKGARKIVTKAQAALVVVGADVSQISSQEQCLPTSRGYQYKGPVSTFRQDQSRYGQRWGVIPATSGQVGGIKRSATSKKDAHLLDNYPYKQNPTEVNEPTGTGRAFAEDFNWKTSPGAFFIDPKYKHKRLYKREMVPMVDAFMAEYNTILEYSPEWAHRIGESFMKQLPGCAPEFDRCDEHKQDHERTVSHIQETCRQTVQTLEQQLADARNKLKRDKNDVVMQLAQNRLDIEHGKAEFQELSAMAQFCNTKLRLLQQLVPINVMPFPWQMISTEDSHKTFSMRAKMMPLALASNMITYHNEIGRFMGYDMPTRHLAIVELCCLFRHILAGRRMLEDILQEKGQYRDDQSQGENDNMTHFLHNYIGSVVRPDDILTFIKINLEKENSKETVLKEHRHLYKYFVRHYNIVQVFNSMEEPISLGAVMSLGEKYDYQMYQDQDNINVGLNAPYSKPFNWKFAVWDMTENKTLALAASRRNNLQNEDLIDTMKKIIERANNEIARQEELFQDMAQEIFNREQEIDQLQNEINTLNADYAEDMEAAVSDGISGRASEANTAVDTFPLRYTLPLPGNGIYPFSPFNTGHRGPQTCASFCQRTFAVGTPYFDSCCNTFVCMSCTTLMSAGQRACSFCRREF